ncbi:hypothetical protein [Bacillus sp. PS06]|uniref:hypothetical protein n=1 Tax=Bacillus sp. PS06 TaxID=2764176 RepID=UPI0017806D9E|nr:hypothetical protein [Bacillus sp. PS06]MBD8068169.1 hypothetical protein [Bacillus sp. PS06]
MNNIIKVFILFLLLQFTVSIQIHTTHLDASHAPVIMSELSEEASLLMLSEDKESPILHILLTQIQEQTKTFLFLVLFGIKILLLKQFELLKPIRYQSRFIVTSSSF